MTLYYLTKKTILWPIFSLLSPLWNEYFMDWIDRYVLFHEVCLEIKSHPLKKRRMKDLSPWHSDCNSNTARIHSSVKPERVILLFMVSTIMAIQVTVLRIDMNHEPHGAKCPYQGAKLKQFLLYQSNIIIRKKKTKTRISPYRLLSRTVTSFHHT